MKRYQSLKEEVIPEWLKKLEPSFRPRSQYTKVQESNLKHSFFCTQYYLELNRTVLRVCGSSLIYRRWESVLCQVRINTYNKAGIVTVYLRLMPKRIA